MILQFEIVASFSEKYVVIYIISLFNEKSNDYFLSGNTDVVNIGRHFYKKHFITKNICLFVTPL